MSDMAVKLAVLALVALIGFGTGWKVQGWRKDSEIAEIAADIQAATDKARANTKRIEALQAQAADVAAVLEVERNKAARVVERVITNDVIKYVQRPGSQSCGVDSDGVRIINASATGRLPTDTHASSAPDARATGVTAAAVVANVTDNYGVCHDNANQLRALQAWVRALRVGPGS
jgi:hypothetical protein